MLRHIDTRQLQVLRILLEECSVTRAAQILDQSQPQVSQTLRRLRAVIGDQILVRSGAKLVPTERGRAMLAEARAVLDGIDRIVGVPQRFDPAVARAAFRIASADCMEAIFLQPLVERLHASAPGARVVVRGIDASFDYAEALERDELDAVQVGEKLGFEDMRPIDLAICGCVAVTEAGGRTGKGGGFADLELGLFRELGKIGPDTPIVTTVHSSMIVADDRLPILEHDSLLDWIVTEAAAIRTRATRPQPGGVVWDLVQPDQLEDIWFLKALKEKILAARAAGTAG